MPILRGKPVSSGIVAAPCHLHDSLVPQTVQPANLAATSVEKELNRLLNAVKKSRAQLKKIYLTVEKKMGSSSALIVGIQRQLLDDPSLINEITGLITGAIDMG